MSGVWLALAVALAGGLGAAVRLAVDGAVAARTRLAYPLGTTVINVSGSFLLGVLTGAVAARLLPPEWGVILGTGLLGGYTTFSTASVETVRLALAGRWRAAAANGFGMLAAALVAAAAGLWLGGLL